MSEYIYFTKTEHDDSNCHVLWRAKDGSDELVDIGLIKKHQFSNPDCKEWMFTSNFSDRTTDKAREVSGMRHHRLSDLKTQILNFFGVWNG